MNTNRNGYLMGVTKVKIYIVKAHGGEWEDSWDSNVKAFNTKEKAEEYVKECEKNTPEYSEYFDRLITRIYAFAHIQALKVPEEQYYEELDRVGNCMREKAHKKYPRYTEYRDEANVWYNIDEVEMGE